MRDRKLLRQRTAADAAAALKPLLARFAGQTALVFATGPSLEKLWAGRRSDLPKIAVNDAWRIVRGADILYATDDRWYLYHKGVPEFRGGLKVSYGASAFPDVHCLHGSGCSGYDERLGFVRHGSNSGYAALHLAAQLGAKRIAMVGYDMRVVKGQVHFFGEHPKKLRSPSHYAAWAKNYIALEAELTARGVEVVNCTPGSAVKCFPMATLEDVL